MPSEPLVTLLYDVNAARMQLDSMLSLLYYRAGSQLPSGFGLPTLADIDAAIGASRSVERRVNAYLHEVEAYRGD